MGLASQGYYGPAPPSRVVGVKVIMVLINVAYADRWSWSQGCPLGSPGRLGGMLAWRQSTARP
jgi:hypothetical protein